MNHANQARNYGDAQSQIAGAGRAIGTSPAPVSRIQEALESLSVALNDLAVTEGLLVSRVVSVSKPVGGPKDQANRPEELTVQSPVVEQINALRQRVLNITGSMNDTLQRLES